MIFDRLVGGVVGLPTALAGLANDEQTNRAPVQSREVCV